jgi:transcriptional regulator NrdR family protein
VNCKQCEAATEVKDSRRFYDKNLDLRYVERRRLCPECGNRFVTIELTKEEWLNQTGLKDGS